MTATPYTALGRPVEYLGEDLFAVTYPEPITEEMAAHIKEAWQRLIGPDKRLIVLDSGAQLTRLDARLPAEPTPIYDQLVAERAA